MLRSTRRAAWLSECLHSLTTCWLALSQRSEGDWRIKILPHCPAAVAPLILACTDANPARRPTFGVLQKQLRVAEAAQKLRPPPPLQRISGGAAGGSSMESPSSGAGAGGEAQWGAAAAGGSSYISEYVSTEIETTRSAEGSSADAGGGTPEDEGSSSVLFCQEKKGRKG